jgi:hypothetical protein
MIGSNASCECESAEFSAQNTLSLVERLQAFKGAHDLSRSGLMEALQAS